MVYIVAVFSLAFVSLLIFVAYKLFIKKETIHNYYTPFDHITGQVVYEFQEENLEDEEVEESEQGDGKRPERKL
ncbi:DUF3951 domain-containing protein [Halobacillus sp. BAB-2008]|uniref:DUF3951 domain-containing protein n=1 Tax=Halobacillus sp. BAB-2008 TaxID=1246484 RepID=UPI0002A51A08|nr:DUF3951 domain-containing protein [Halobacillus sp. BAB-2008]ELK48530.1 hypothetical protein D479_02902 [Halobacillus sp. BAB-2008]